VGLPLAAALHLLQPREDAADAEGAAAVEEASPFTKPLTAAIIGSLPRTIRV
jgi:hypothetical protein